LDDTGNGGKKYIAVAINVQLLQYIDIYIDCSTLFEQLFIAPARNIADLLHFDFPSKTGATGIK
jgi:hypothetical protein